MAVADELSLRRIRIACLAVGAAFGVVTAAPRESRAEAPNRIASPAVVRQSRIVLEVENETTAKSVASAAEASGGQLVRASDTDVVVDVPATSYREFLERLRPMGRLASEHVTSDEVTDDLADSRASASAARARRARLDGLQPKAGSVADRLLLEREVERSEQAEASAERLERELLHRSGVVRVAVQLARPEQEPIPSPSLPFAWLDELGLERLSDPGAVLPSRRERELRSVFELAALLRAGYVHDREPLDDVPVLGAGTIEFRMLGEATPVGLYGGLDLSLGAGGGFLFGAQSLLGAGVPLGERLAVGLATGPGVDGITGVVPTGFTLPIELRAFVDLATWMGVTMWVQDGWVPGNDARRHGSSAAPWGDELAAGLRLSPNSRDGSMYSEHRAGWAFGLGYRELMGTRVFELSFGFGGHESDFSTGY